MAKDVSSKTASSTSNTSPPISDQQKVPPLRIVLNTSGNQKSSSTAVAATTNPQQQTQDLKRERTQDARVDGPMKSGGRVRIKLGTNKQVSKGSFSETPSDDASKSKGTIVERQDNIFKEEINHSLSHLRRITRRSQRSVQTVNNEDEESISSMTSTDENQNTTNNNNSDNNSGQDNAATAVASSQSNTGSSVQANSGTSNSSSNNNNADIPRRYKRRRGEVSESQLSEHDELFGFQNYKLPVQNSFELYKNIRKQVDKKLKSLTIVHPKTPFGFRDYMLTRGAYLLDGNKLGNGTNLFMNEDGGLHSAPISKYHALKHNRVNYSVPNRSKVPLGLPVNSPLYNLFIEQEKERYRMRMQHIKEREKLTLAAEQEIVRVYNQAAMAAANQLEPFSACTMLKHQEIYNYMDSNGVTIQSSENDQLDDQIKQEGVRTRRRQHEQISPAPTRKNSNTDECQSLDANQKDTQLKSPEQTTSIDETQKEITEQLKETTKEKTVIETSQDNNSPGGEEGKEANDDCVKRAEDTSQTSETEDKKVVDIIESESTPAIGTSVINEPTPGTGDVKKKSEAEVLESTVKKEIKQEPLSDDTKSSKGDSKTEAMDISEAIETKETDDDCPKTPCKDTADDEKQKQSSEIDKTGQDQSATSEPSELKAGGVAGESVSTGEDGDQMVAMEQDTEAAMRPDLEAELVLTDDDRRAYNKEIFLSQLQGIDDKWDKIRSEMFIRHRNEAESLYAVQRLEWEWKTKEIGACDIRTTPIIDNTLVPKLNIYSQDY